MSTIRSTFRIGQVKGYLHSRVWYLCYHENGRRRRPRVGTNREAAKQLAAETNAQLAHGDLPMLSFEPIKICDLRQRWLDHHEHVLRSSLHTINRYRTATDHLLNFLSARHPVRLASMFTALDVESFVQYLAHLDVSPNGHANSKKRKLLDKGIKYILECCRAMYRYAAKRRHLSAYAENPFTTAQVDRLPLENVRPIVLFTAEQERRFLLACDDWQFPIFLTLMLTGIRPGELAHLLVEDLDLTHAILHIRNKAKLGWQIKTRSERSIPLVPALADILSQLKGSRTSGALFRQLRCRESGFRPPLDHLQLAELEPELIKRCAAWTEANHRPSSRAERLQVARTVWRDLAAVNEDRIRCEFIRVSRRSGMPDATSPKMLRHLFATTLQDANLDPLVRCVLMGHAPGSGRPGGGLGMTAVYSHTRPETVRLQLMAALQHREAVHIAHLRLG